MACFRIVVSSKPLHDSRLGSMYSSDFGHIQGMVYLTGIFYHKLTLHNYINIWLVELRALLKYKQRLISYCKCCIEITLNLVIHNQLEQENNCQPTL